MKTGKPTEDRWRARRNKIRREKKDEGKEGRRQRRRYRGTLRLSRGRRGGDGKVDRR